MNQRPQGESGEMTNERMAKIEERLSRIETHLGLASRKVEGATSQTEDSLPVSQAAPGETPTEQTENELEFELGQVWFAKVGILVLAIGVAFTLSLPYANLPAILPSAIGYALAGFLFLFAQLWRKSFELVAKYFHGSGMALLFFSTLRLFYFGSTHVLSTESLIGRALLAIAVGISLVDALRRRSPYLFSLGLGSACITVVAVDSSGYTLGALLILCLVVVHAQLKQAWPGLVLLAAPMIYATYFIWAVGNPVLGRALHFVPGPSACLGFILAYTMILAGAAALRVDREREGGLVFCAALLNCGIGYPIFLLHSFSSFEKNFALANTAASLVYLVLAIVFWVREESRLSTFLYAMTGYMALSISIINVFGPPNVFIWLALQGVVVVATAIWFRSRFIVVANFLIYVIVVAGYMLLAKTESGISLVFGVVALVSARILNWKQHRLELKTELMRNSYLVGAFIVFPYALYHLVPGTYVGLAWVGLALFYYAINVLIQNQKYRWMGHCTLLITVVYLLIVGISRFEPLHRNLSFLVLGAVLLVVSLIFTKMKKRSS